jgi:zinc and cadmium transporter
MQQWNFLILFLGPFIGAMLAHVTKASQIRLKLFLAFSGAFLFSVTVLSLLPEVYETASPLTGVFILLGFFFQIFIEQFSKGIEHGHIHHRGEAGMSERAIGIGVFISLSLHSFLEGMPFGANLFDDRNTHFSLLFGITLHEIPAAFALVTVLRMSETSKTRIFTLALLYCLMAPAGAFLSRYISNNSILDESVLTYIMALVIGTFLHISTTILFENSENHSFSKLKLTAIILGTGIALLTLI